MWALLLDNIALLAVLGIVTGVLSGLFGIGGGALIVPGLLFIFKSLGLPINTLMHYAIGTSFGIMVFTAASAVMSHQKKSNIVWPVFLSLAAGVIPGIIIGSFFANFLHSNWLKIFFGVFFLFLSIKMIFGFREKTAQGKSPAKKTILLAGLIAGFLSSLLGVGGGFIVVPFMKYYGSPMKKVVGTSAAMTLIAALTGTLSYALAARRVSTMVWATGYVYWPAVLLVAPFTILCAGVGVSLTTRLPDKVIRIAFSILLCVVSVRMLLP